MSVALDVAFKNSYEVEFIPTNGGRIAHIACSDTSQTYALDPKDPGVKVHEAALLGAFLSKKQVHVLVTGCVYNKPRVIAVGLKD